MGVFTLSMYAYHAVSGALGEQKWVSDTLQMELQIVLRCPVVLGIEPECSRTGTMAVKHWTISLAHKV